MSDSCATMEGKRSGVKKRLGEKIEGLKDLGACNGHHISNSMQHGAMAFAANVKEVLVNIFFYIGGA